MALKMYQGMVADLEAELKYVPGDADLVRWRKEFEKKLCKGWRVGASDGQPPAGIRGFAPGDPNNSLVLGDDDDETMADG